MIRALLSFFGSLVGFVCTVQVIFCLTVLLVYSNARLHAASAGKPELVEVRSMEKCSPCDRVLAKLDADGVKYTVKPTDMVTATSYPTCIYSTGAWDNGANVLNGNYTVKSIIPITKLVQK